MGHTLAYIRCKVGSKRQTHTDTHTHSHKNTLTLTHTQYIFELILNRILYSWEQNYISLCETLNVRVLMHLNIWNVHET